MQVTIEIGYGFIIALLLTIGFLVHWIRSIANEKRIEAIATQMEERMVKSAGRFTVNLLEVPEVYNAATNLIAGGINVSSMNV